MNAAEALKTRNVTDVFVACTHPVFSGDAVEKFRAAGFGEVVVTDTVPLPAEKRWPELTVLSIASLIGEAISRIHTGSSIGELFQMDDDGETPKVPHSMAGANRG